MTTHDSPTQPTVGTPVRFAADFRIYTGTIESCTPEGHVTILTDTGKHFSMTLDQLTLRSKQAERIATPTPLPIGTRVKVSGVDVPATIVGYHHENYQISYDDLPCDDRGEPFTVAFRGVTCLEQDAASAEQRELEVLRRQMAEVVSEQTALRQAVKGVLSQLTSGLPVDERALVAVLNAALAETESR
ncbi:MAG: hypothetical protein DPW16_18000 [Chloroflexi bacterium]|nr:hypothetical protein [Chloroflexota bacterium]